MFRVYWNLAKSSIKANRTRSFLTCLGVAIGVASLVLILSLTGSVRNLISEEIGEVGENLLIVENNTQEEDLVSSFTKESSFLTSNLSFEDIASIREFEGVEMVTPVALSVNKLVSDKNTLDTVSVLGTDADFVKIWDLNLRYGAFLNDQNENTVVVGHRLALTLFNTDNPVGKSLEIKGEKVVVMGVLSEVGETANLNNIDFDNTLIIGATLAKKLGMQVQQIDILASTTGNMEEVASNVQSKMSEVKGGENNFKVKYGEAITYPADSMLGRISIVLAVIAGVSLVVGGVGVMNIMLLGVAERTREIGVRKAVGATSGDILTQFILEALMLTIVGAIMGIILGYTIAFFISIATAFSPYIDSEICLVTVGVAILTGVVFGIYPALKAAHKSPIESLK